MPEAKLAREAELSYALLAMVTDYDCWHETKEAVDAHQVLDVMRSNIDNALKIISRLAMDFPHDHEPCSAGSDRALDRAVVTDRASRDRTVVGQLDAILRRDLVI